MKSSILIAMAIACVVSSPAAAAPVDVSFSGTSTTAGAYSGRLRYSDDAVSDSGTAFIQRFNVPVSLQFSANGLNFLANSASSVVSIDQGTSNSPYDQTFFAFNLYDASGYYDASVSLNFYENTGTAMIGDGLPTQSELLSFPGASIFFQASGPNGSVLSTGFESVTSVAATPTSAVPEPASWAMMLGGFGLVGAALRRRPKVHTTLSFT